jgi:hypothetical protein
MNVLFAINDAPHTILGQLEQRVHYGMDTTA